MGFPILLRWHIYIESGPWAPRRYLNRVKSIADHACGFRGFDPIDKNITLCMVLYFPLMRITRTIDARFVYVCHWYAYHCYDVANRYVTMCYMMTSSNGNISALLAPLWGESTGHRCIPLTKASDSDIYCFLWSTPEQTDEQTIETPVIWNSIAFIMTSL